MKFPWTTVVLVTLATALPCAAAAGADDPRVGEAAATAEAVHPLSTGSGAGVNRALRLARERDAKAAPCVEALVRIGPGIIEPALWVLEERMLPPIDGGELQVMNNGQEARLLEALRKMNPARVWAAVEARLVTEDGALPALSTRVAAVLAAGTCADATEFPRLIACIRCDPAVELDRTLERALRRAAEDVFLRKPEALERLAGNWRALPSVALPPLVYAAGTAGDPRALRFLEQMLLQQGDLEKISLARLALQRAPASATVELLSKLQERLDSDQPVISQAACNALGALGSFGSVDSLIALLGSESAGVRETAYRALCTMSGLALPAQGSSWQVWRKLESAWYDERANALAYAIESGNELQAINALTEISIHRWERHALSDMAALALTRSEPMVVGKACEVLNLLGSPRAASALAKVGLGENPHSTDKTPTLPVMASR